MSDAIERAVLAGLLAAGMKKAVTHAEEKAPPDRPRWKDGTPRRQLPDGRWQTDFRALLEEKYDVERMMCDEGYARSVYAALGSGDEEVGLRRFGEVNAELGAEEKAQIITDSKTAGGRTQSDFEANKEKIYREERVEQLRQARQAIDQQISAIEIDPSTPPE